ncbi:hypothetical protein BTW32_26185 [Bacillus thuringiensis]|nr:hypothetical protein BTW32_26185 [Bacillus thuringiensis]
MYFTATHVHQELNRANFVDILIKDVQNPSIELPFKGNIGINKLEQFFIETGRIRIPYGCVAVTVNLAGGQPTFILMLDAKVFYLTEHKTNFLHNL